MKIALISDIHEDITRLQKAFQLIEEKKCDEIVCLGDIVGYSYLNYNFPTTKNASECIKLVKSNCKIVVAGNHDFFSIKRLPNYKAGIEYPENWYELNFDERRNILQEKIWDYSFDLKPNLKESDIEYLSKLLEIEIAEFNGENILLSHFLFPDLNGSTTNYPKNTNDLSEHFSLMAENNCNFSFSGHGHYNGIMIANENNIGLNDFGISKLKGEKNWASIPCIAKGKRRNGFVIFHLNDRIVETVEL